jgi:hypothetical protein
LVASTRLSWILAWTCCLKVPEKRQSPYCLESWSEKTGSVGS